MSGPELSSAPSGWQNPPIGREISNRQPAMSKEITTRHLELQLRVPSGALVSCIGSSQPDPIDSADLISVPSRTQLGGRAGETARASRLLLCRFAESTDLRGCLP
jgi:hypothetical protein